MRILMTGATGFLGRAVVLRLLRDGHQVTAWVRSKQKAMNLLGGDVKLCEALEGETALRQAVANSDAVINLAGAPIFGRRWSAKVLKDIEESRILSTQQLVRAMNQSGAPPKVFISASAVGFYGSHPTGNCTENSPAGNDILANICQRWEEAAQALQVHPHTTLETAVELAGENRDEGIIVPSHENSIRQLCLRFGIIIGPEGGLLKALLPLFQMGIAHVLGSGEQMLPWVSLDDAVEVIMQALENADYHGPINVVSPQTVTYKQFCRLLAEATERPLWLKIPEIAVRFLLGEASSAVLSDQHIVPEKLQQLGYRFIAEDLATAMQNYLCPDSIDLGPFSPFAPKPLQTADTSYLFHRPPHYVLRARTKLSAGIEEVFPFFAQAANLGLLTPSWMQFRVQGKLPEEIKTGTVINYMIALGPLPMKWRTKIAHWDPPHAFVDSQEKGPYASWWHEHTFDVTADGIVMHDRVFYALPLGFLGKLAHFIFVKPLLRRIFAYRSHAIQLRFSGAAQQKSGQNPSY